MTAKKVLGCLKAKKKPWVTKDVLNLCNCHQVLKSEKLNNLEAADAYRKFNHKTCKGMKAGRAIWIENRYSKIDEVITTRHLAYLIFTKEDQQKTSAIEDSKGRLLSDDKAVLE